MLFCSVLVPHLAFTCDAAYKSGGRPSCSLIQDTGQHPERWPEVARKECDPADRETGGVRRFLEGVLR